MASYKEKNPGRNNYPPLSAHVSLSKKGMPKILISISATYPTYILTKNYIYGFQIAFIHFKNII